MKANLLGRSPAFYKYMEGLKMRTHAVKETIKDNVLRVEVEPHIEDFNEIIQDPRLVIFWLAHRGTKEKFQRIQPPISLGETVYQGEEWIYYSPIGKGGVEETEKTNFVKTKSEIAGVHRKMMRSIDKFKWRTPETMPIERAAKTFKVIGIEVEKKELAGNIVLNPPKWFWSFQLEGIS